MSLTTNHHQYLTPKRNRFDPRILFTNQIKGSIPRATSGVSLFYLFFRDNFISYKKGIN